MPIPQSLYLSHTEEGRSASASTQPAVVRAKLETNLINLRNKKWKTGKIIAIIKKQRRHRSKTNTLSIR